MRSIRPLSGLIVGLALFAGMFLILRFTTSLPPGAIVGAELLAAGFWQLVRSFIGPISTHNLLRNAQILRSLPIGLLGLSFILDEWAATSRFAVAMFLVAVLLYYAVSRPYIRKALRQVEQGRAA